MAVGEKAEGVELGEGGGGLLALLVSVVVQLRLFVLLGADCQDAVGRFEGKERCTVVPD